MEKFYVTTPIYYVNDLPHIGHAYTTIAADILARFNRLMGRRVFFLTGTDEHGQKVQKAAESRGLSPKEHADRMVLNFKRLWKTLNISNDAFIRTTDEAHKAVVQEVLQKLYEKGEIVKRPYKGWYCTPDERFWTTKELEDGKCPECGRPVEELEEENYFFLMSRYQEPLIDYIRKNPEYILPETRRNEVLGFLTSRPLGDLCISRPRKRLPWGIPLPFDDGFVTYVWFDALINYYSATRYLAPDRDVQWWPADHHIVGKDILTTHAVYWSTMLMALDMPLPRNIFAHGWWTVEGRKMSKSFGNVVDPEKVVEEYGVDPFRYFLFREVPFGSDGDFSEKALVGRINSDLANDLGNLVSRTLTMLQRYTDSVVPEPSGVEEEAKRLSEGILPMLQEHLNKLSFQRAIDEIWRLIDYLNKYIDTNQPWALAKRPEDRDRLSTVLYTAVEGLRFIAIYLWPFIPQTAERLYRMLGYERFEATLREMAQWGGMRPGTKVSGPEQLFPRIVPKRGEAKVEKSGERKEETGGEGIIEFEDFSKVKMKVGRVVEAERVKGSKKLLRLVVDVGQRVQVVAGIGTTYTPESLIGKEVVVVVNLRPVTLMGVESQGMILATGQDRDIVLITPERDVPPGSTVR